MSVMVGYLVNGSMANGFVEEVECQEALIILIPSPHQKALRSRCMKFNNFEAVKAD